jgi:hypothetical protein
MTTFDKPSLDEVYLEHFGIKGMRWGQRKAASSSSSSSSSGASTHPVFTTKQKVVATAALGSAAAISVLAVTGNLGSVSAGAGRLAGNGAKAVGGLMLRGARNVVVGSAKGIGRGIGKGATAAWRVVSPAQPPAPPPVLKRTGKERIKDILSKRPKKPEFKPETQARLESYMAKFKRDKTPKAQLKLYPTKSLIGSDAASIRGLQLSPEKPTFTRSK